MVSLFPAHAGMAPRTRRSRRCRCSVPRTRRDGPKLSTWATPTSSCSPHTQGWPEIIDLGNSDIELFPAHAGMTRTWCWPWATIWTVSHPRGDGAQLVEERERRGRRSSLSGCADLIG